MLTKIVSLVTAKDKSHPIKPARIPFEGLSKSLKTACEQFITDCNDTVDASYPKKGPELAPATEMRDLTSFKVLVAEMQSRLKQTPLYTHILENYGQHDSHHKHAAAIASMVCDEFTAVLKDVHELEIMDLGRSRKNGYNGGYIGLFCVYVELTVLTAFQLIIESPGRSKADIHKDLLNFAKLMADAKDYCLKTLNNDHCAYYIFLGIETKFALMEPRGHKKHKETEVVSPSKIFAERLESGTHLEGYMPPFLGFSQFLDRKSASFKTPNASLKFLGLIVKLSDQLARIRTFVDKSPDRDISVFKEVANDLNIYYQEPSVGSEVIAPTTIEVLLINALRKKIESESESKGFRRSGTYPFSSTKRVTKPTHGVMTRQTAKSMLLGPADLETDAQTQSTPEQLMRRISSGENPENLASLTSETPL